MITAISHPKVVHKHIPVNVCPTLIIVTPQRLMREIPSYVRSLVETDHSDPYLIRFLFYLRSRSYGSVCCGAATWDLEVVKVGIKEQTQ